MQQGTGACGTLYSGTIVKVSVVQVGYLLYAHINKAGCRLLSKYNISHRLSSNRQQLWNTKSCYKFHTEGSFMHNSGVPSCCYMSSCHAPTQAAIPMVHNYNINGLKTITFGFTE